MIENIISNENIIEREKNIFEKIKENCNREIHCV